MASDYQNLSFHNRADIKRWRDICAEQRRVALRWPAYDPRMSSIEEYGFRLGPWSLRLVLEIWKKPYLWHASAACIHHIGYETFHGERGETFEIPKDELIERAKWLPEHVEQADFLLNGIIGDLIRAEDNSQQVSIYDALYARHLTLKYEGEELWRTKQH